MREFVGGSPSRTARPRGRNFRPTEDDRLQAPEADPAAARLPIAARRVVAFRPSRKLEEGVARGMAGAGRSA